MSVKGVFAAGDVQNMLYIQCMVAIDIEKLGGRGIRHRVAQCSVVENYHEQPQDRKPCSCFCITFPILTFLWNTVVMKYDDDGNLLTFTLTAHGSNFEHFRAHLSQTRFPCQTPSPGSYILTMPGTAQMNVTGVFAASDVQNKMYRVQTGTFPVLLRHQPRTSLVRKPKPTRAAIY